MTTRTHHLRGRRGALLAALAALVLALSVLPGLRTPVSAEPAASPQRAVRPTIVLVHGAFADASGWSQEVSLLQRAGYPVLAPADPLRGLTADADYIRSVLATIDGPVVLVGHSYGGAVITNAARGASNVVALVYIAAFVPDVGLSVATSYDPQQYPGSLLGGATLVVRPAPNAVAPGGQDADLYIRADQFQTVFAGDQSAGTAAVMAATQRPLSSFAFTEPSGEPAWRTIPSWDLVTLNDHAISAGGQRFMAQRAGATIRTVASAHDVMVSHPATVVAVILEAAARTR